MTEKSESFEIHPMRGHSRGEWWGTLGDIVESDDDAEYWAVFGVTHRGNKHCLGEFPSKSAAIAATRGLKHFPTSIPIRPRTEGNRRQIVQLMIVTDARDDSMIELFALCNDGTVWHRGIGVRDNRGFVDEAWEEVTLDGLESDQ
jgi:hypothetical protein